MAMTESHVPRAAVSSKWGSAWEHQWCFLRSFGKSQETRILSGKEAADAHKASCNLNLPSPNPLRLWRQTTSPGHPRPSDQLRQEARRLFVPQQTRASHRLPPGTLRGNARTALRLRMCLMRQGPVSVQGQYFKSLRRREQSFKRGKKQQILNRLE